MKHFYKTLAALVMAVATATPALAQDITTLL